MKPISRYVSVFVKGTVLLGTILAGQALAQGTDWAPPMPRFKTSGGEISIERGEKVYQENCVNCHGMHGKGEGFKKYSWDEDQIVPDLTDMEYMEMRGDEIIESLNDGRRLSEPPFVVMTAFRYVISANDQKSVRAYIKTLQVKN